MNIVNVGYDSTNYYVLEVQHMRLLIDVGWPGTLPKLQANLKRKGIALADIQCLLLSLADSATFLGKLGIIGTIISTPGHSDDSISLILPNTQVPIVIVRGHRHSIIC